MYNSSKPSFFKKHLDSLAAGVLAFIAILLNTQGRIAVTTDSIVYLHAAKSIFCCHEFTQFNGFPLVEFPFFYPWFLGFIQWLSHCDLVATAPVINGCLFALLLFFSAHLLEKAFPQKRIFKWITLLLISTSPPLLQAYSSLWSETIFNIEVLLFLIGYFNYSRDHSIKSLAFVIIVTAIACITRYAAVSLIACGALLVMLDKKLTWNRKLIHGSLFIAGSISLLVINMARNYLAAGTLTGVRQKGSTSLPENLFYYGKVIAGWLPGLSAQSNLYVIISSITILLLIIIFTIHYYKDESYSISSLLAFFALIYTLFFLAVSTLFNFERIDNRFLTPVYIPLLIACTSGLYSFNRHQSGLGWKWKVMAISGVYILLIAGQVQGNLLLKNDVSYKTDPSYNDTTWQQSDIVRYLKTHKDIFQKGYSFYSNSNEAFYFFTGRASDRLPQKINKPEIKDFLEQDSVYIIWFKKVKASDEISDTFFLNNKSMKPLQTFKDGAVYISRDEDDE